MLERVVNIARDKTPATLRPAARYVYRAGKSLLLRFCPSFQYEQRKNQETQFFGVCNRGRELPAIFHYWSNKFVVPLVQPLGFSNALECFRSRLALVCKAHPSEECRFLSIGAGSCEAEINMAEWLHESNVRNFTFECVDITAASVEQAAQLARQRGVQDCFRFSVVDVNQWKPRQKYHSIVALQSLHHIVELETLLDRVNLALYDDGYFLADDMIGRNGHQRWPEALEFVQALWKELPDRCKYNHQLQRFEKDFDDFDCSNEGFEGIRAQDILALLMQRFNFEVFVAFGNVIDVFVDRNFGPNFDPQSEWDKTFIDRVQAVDVTALEEGLIKPTHMIAVMRRAPVQRTIMHKHFSPEYCLRPANPV